MAKPKPVNYDVIEDNAKRQPEAYRLLDQVRLKWHADMSDARIALAWRKRQKADKDGHLVLGRCVRISDLQKEFMPFDFVIVLNREVWEDTEFTKEKKLALLDHEMCHATPLLDDSTGEHKSDEKERLCYRMRKHDIEEFREIVERHGCYKADLEKFAEALLQKRAAPLLNKLEETPTVTQ